MNPSPEKKPPAHKPFRLSLGERGEMAALGWLVQNGYKILAKNYRCALGELDAVASRKNRVYFVEVKTRSGTGFGRPEEAVTRDKQRRLARLAALYLKDKKLTQASVSFAVISVLWRQAQAPEIRMIADAFSLEGEC
ncbi:MAG: hypothetical protein A2Y02_01720 [Omnitrophica bacterium GWA2_52_12]|nr:MAG: hypothetical protein A2Y02_01720 [Omnitrophica bacterium GWA2_52_12]